MRLAASIAATVMIAMAAGTAAAQAPAGQNGSEQNGSDKSAPSPETRIDAAAARGVEFLLGAQEGDDAAEWPYEGVYRVRGQIPIGYRVGGTAIGATALMRSPGYADDAPRREAVGRAVAFVCKGIEHPLMSEKNYDAGYDVRGWGYTYGLAFLLELKAAGAAPEGMDGEIEGAVAFYLDAIHKTEIPKAGGWNYARQPGRDAVCPPSSFMTSATLQALFEAKRQGYEVDGAVVERGLASLERSRASSGAVVYSGEATARSREGVPGAVGRMVITESTLALAGRSTPAQIRGAVDAFITHWEWLNKRRAQPGTHVAPYGVAPYYFAFAHYYAAQAVELLPRHERAEYRRRINDLLFSVQGEDGTWNDRVFPRSASYGTAMAMMATLMPRTLGETPGDGGRERGLARWEAGAGTVGEVAGAKGPAKGKEGQEGAPDDQGR